MNNKIFIDTEFIIGLIYQKDQYHSQAVNLSIKYENYFFVTTDAVLLELGNAVVRHSKFEAVNIIEEFMISDNVEIIHLTPQLFEEAFNLYKRFEDKTWGLVDPWNSGHAQARGCPRHRRARLVRPAPPSHGESTAVLGFPQVEQVANPKGGVPRDCLSFIVMRNLGINQVLTFDRHFSQAGFQILT